MAAKGARFYTGDMRMEQSGHLLILNTSFPSGLCYILVNKYYFFRHTLSTHSTGNRVHLALSPLPDSRVTPEQQGLCSQFPFLVKNKALHSILFSPVLKELWRYTKERTKLNHILLMKLCEWDMISPCSPDWFPTQSYPRVRPLGLQVWRAMSSFSISSSSSNPSLSRKREEAAFSRKTHTFPGALAIWRPSSNAFSSCQVKVKECPDPCASLYAFHTAQTLCSHISPFPL